MNVFKNVINKILKPSLLIFLVIYVLLIFFTTPIYEISGTRDSDYIKWLFLFPCIILILEVLIFDKLDIFKNIFLVVIIISSFLSFLPLMIYSQNHTNIEKDTTQLMPVKISVLPKKGKDSVFVVKNDPCSPKFKDSIVIKTGKNFHHICIFEANKNNHHYEKKELNILGDLINQFDKLDSNKKEIIQEKEEIENKILKKLERIGISTEGKKLRTNTDEFKYFYNVRIFDKNGKRVIDEKYINFLNNDLTNKLEEIFRKENLDKNQVFRKENLNKDQIFQIIESITSNVNYVPIMNWQLWINYVKFLIVLHLIFILLLTFIAIEQFLKIKWMQSWQEVFSKTHFGLLMMFFAMFLNITYLFGFAFYFHNEFVYAESLKKNHGIKYGLQMVNDHEPFQYDDIDKDTNYDKPKSTPKFSLFFDKNGHHLILNRKTKNNFSIFEKEEINILSKLPSYKIIPLPKSTETIVETTNEQIIKLFVNRIEKMVTNGQTIRISLNGYTSNDGTVKNNYDLSELRINSVKTELDKYININKEWSQFHNPAPFECITTNKEIINERCRRVDIRAETLPDHITREQLREANKEKLGIRISLLDGFYFAAYTITTTGYGDIAPISATAKFLTICANFFEVLFIVICIGAMISLRPEKKLEKQTTIEKELAEIQPNLVNIKNEQQNTKEFLAKIQKSLVDRQNEETQIKEKLNQQNKYLFQLNQKLNPQIDTRQLRKNILFSQNKVYEYEKALFEIQALGDSEYEKILEFLNTGKILTHWKELIKETQYFESESHTVNNDTWFNNVLRANDLLKTYFYDKPKLKSLATHLAYVSLALQAVLKEYGVEITPVRLLEELPKNLQESARKTTSNRLDDRLLMELTYKKVMSKLSDKVPKLVVDIEEYGFITQDNPEPSIKVLYADLGGWEFFEKN